MTLPDKLIGLPLLQTTFVVHRQLLQTLISSIKESSTIPAHSLIIAPTGMGKSTLLQLLPLELQQESSYLDWQLVRFPSESYGIYDLADFCLEILNRLVLETADTTLAKQATALKTEFLEQRKQLQTLALALVREWQQNHGKKLLFLIDNFDIILEQIFDQSENEQLHELLWKENNLIFICTAKSLKESLLTSFSLPQSFRIYSLAKLTLSQLQQWFVMRAKLEEKKELVEFFQHNLGLLRIFAHFIAGNLQLADILYLVLATSSSLKVEKILEKLLDEAIFYYRTLFESLPFQQRKILELLARSSYKTNEGVAINEISEALRVTTSQASILLKRLTEQDYLSLTKLRGRAQVYTFSHPLYALWQQMQLERELRTRLCWLAKLWECCHCNKITGDVLLLPELLVNHIEQLQQANLLWQETTCNSMLIEMIEFLRMPAEDEREKHWQAALSHSKVLSVEQNQIWQHLLWATLLSLLYKGERALVIQLISSAKLEEEFLPLMRVVEYLNTNDLTTIEKLSPEVRGIAQAVVAQLQATLL